MQIRRQSVSVGECVFRSIYYRQTIIKGMLWHKWVFHEINYREIENDDKKCSARIHKSIFKAKYLHVNQREVMEPPLAPSSFCVYPRPTRRKREWCCKHIAWSPNNLNNRRTREYDLLATGDSWHSTDYAWRHQSREPVVKYFLHPKQIH